MSTDSRPRVPLPAKARRLPISHKILRDWGGPQVFRDAEALFQKGLVEDASYQPPYITGTIRWSNRSLRSRLKVLPDGAAESACPCRDNTERGLICAHVIALGLSLIARHTDPQREIKHQEERRRAERLSRFDEAAYIQRAPDHPDAVPAELRLSLGADWAAQVEGDGIVLRCEALYRNTRSGLAQVPRKQPFAFRKADEDALYVLEDMAGGPAPDTLRVGRSDFINLLQILRGGQLHLDDGTALAINEMGIASRLHMDLDRENGELILMIHTELPFMKAGEFPRYIIEGGRGWVHGAANFWPLEALLPLPLRSIYKEPVIVPRVSVPRFMRVEWPALGRYMTLESDISLDLFTIEAATPSFRLLLRGSPASLAPALFAEYPGMSLIAGKEDPAGEFAIPDPNDILRYTVRDLAAEKRALETLGALGMGGPRGDELTPVVGCREVLNILGGRMPTLRRLGWKVQLEGKVEPFMDGMNFVTPVVHVNAGSGENWFEVDFNFECPGEGSLSEADIQRAMLKGDSYVERGGRTVLFDADAVAALHDVFSDVSGQDGSGQARMRMSNLHAAFIKSSLDALDGVDVESSPAWRASAAVQNREMEITPVDLGEPLETIMRPYQKAGVRWLAFLERNDFGGILADEMGLGKTLQTLAWLQLERRHETDRGLPTLIVCPTSLVENWAEEAARFTPNLRCLILAGADRKNRWSEIGGANLVITSYALLRRDVDLYVETQFAAIVLDEAQHIKNRSTQNALAAKQLRGRHRLVLTGTPIENSVSDLWSIMDFLMPGYLGPHDAFRQRFELPIARAQTEGEEAQTRLRRKLHPFLMRRLKVDVAADLPAKIERVMSCALTPDQQLVYKQYLEASRRRLSDIVAARGFDKSRMEILKVLLRLRQVCCHLDLLKLPDLNSKFPSAKMDVFFELVDEALDGGHRILVFSQFTSMLRIIQREIAARGLSHCYLDGATKDRLAIVREFNTNRSIPLFLISLKAGGTGLNLTGADMVIHFDPWWNPAVEDQATDRAHRIGQKRTVYSVKLITKDTVEEKVLAMQNRKREVIDATLAASGDAFRKLTWSDIQNLLTL